MELTVNVKLNGMPTAKRVAKAAEKMSTFKSTVLLRRGDITVNANSLSALVTGRLPIQELALLDTVELVKNEKMVEALFPQKGSCILDFF